jgi:hypothetical protein
VKQHLSAIRQGFDWLVTGGRLQVNPAASVRGPTDALNAPHIVCTRKLATGPCDLIARKAMDDKPCEVLVRILEKTLALGRLAYSLEIPPAIMAIVKGRGESEAVSPEGLQFVRVPDRKGE